MICVRLHLLGCASAGESGGFGALQGRGLCPLFKQLCRREIWEGKGEVEPLAGLPGCREGDLPGTAAQQLQRKWQGVLVQRGLEGV